MATIPNVITHGLMALDVFNELEESVVKQAIEKHPRAFLLGSNGPDILFYYNVFPWDDAQLNKKVAKIGNLVHTESINDFYRYAVLLVLQTEDQVKKDILISYLAGHLMHWSLDSLAHPFVFYRSGEIAGETKYWHYRYESMIDALMLAYVKRKDMTKVKPTRFVGVSDVERHVIASFYKNIVTNVFATEITVEEIDSAIVSMKKAIKILYDPHNIKTPFIKAFENKLAEPWALSSHVVNSELDDVHDILNLKHDVWANPTDIEDTSTLSFVDLYDYSIKLGQILLERLNVILAGEDVSFDDILENCQYDTGRPVGLKMKYYNNIYK